jgi:hypothetical protein
MKKETNETIKQPTLTNAEVINLLIELSDTKYWDAIQVYYSGLQKTAERAIISTDAFKQPTFVARNQGFIQALPYLKIFVEIEKKKRIDKGEENKI